MHNKKKTKIVGVILIVLVFLTTNFITYYVTKHFSVLTGDQVVVDVDDETAVDSINKMILLINKLEDESYYNEDFTEEDLWDGAVKGLMEATGDNYAYYFNEEETEAYSNETDGYYVGIGVMVGNNDDGNVEVSKVFSGSPAESAGILPGDVIVSADDNSLIGIAVELAVTMIKGEEGTTVHIGVERGDDTLEFDIERAVIEYVYMEHEMLDEQIGYIHVYQFVNGTYNDFVTAYNDLTANGMQGLVIDLRQNPGGLVDQAEAIADMLLPQCELYYTLDTDGRKIVEESDAASVDIPIVVLIDEYSASASEILSIALQVNNKAVFVGETSYGKGIIQTVMSIRADGTLYKFTKYEYFGADGTPVHGVGIEPDYKIEKGELYDLMLVESIPHDEDAQLIKAIEIMDDLLQ